MKDFSDIVNRNIVIFLLLAFIIYLNFVSSQLQRDKNWQGVKCNPLQMVVGSIINSEGSNNAFKRCMQYSYSENLNNQIDQYSRANDKKVKTTSDKLNQIINQKEPSNPARARTDAKINRLYNSTRGSLANIQDLKTGVVTVANELKTLLDDLKGSPADDVKLEYCEEVNKNKNNKNSRSIVSNLGRLGKIGNNEKKLNLGGIFNKSKKGRGGLRSIFKGRGGLSISKKRNGRRKRRR